MVNPFNDVRIALRTLARRPLFVLSVAGTLALGIGATSAIFSVLYGILLRPLPFDEPDRLAVVWESNPTRGHALMAAAPPNVADWTAQGTTVDDIGFYADGEYPLATDTGSELVRVSRMTTNLLTVLRVRPAIGRLFRDADGQPGATRALLLTDAAWRRLFDGDPTVVGRSVTLGGAPAEVVGVMPPDVVFPLPIAFDGTARTAPVDGYVAFRANEVGPRSARYVRAIGRLAPGATVETAERELRAIAARLEIAYPDSNAGWTVRVVPFAEQVVGETRPALVALFAAVTFVLLLACANAAHLLLARAVDRGREVAVRVALGAGRLHLARQLLTEGLALGVIGAAGGVLLAGWTIRVLLGIAPATIPRLHDVQLDGWTLGAALGAGIVASALASLAPITHVWRADPTLALRDRSAAGASGVRTVQRLVLGVESTVAVVLVVMASLIGGSFLKLSGIDPGFRPDNVLMFHANAAGLGLATPEARMQFVDALLERLEAVPGVTAAGTIDAAPLSDDRQGTSFEIDGAPPFAVGSEPAINFSFVSPGYFDAMGISLIAGRTFTPADRFDSEPVTIVNDAFARQFFPDGDAVGRRVAVGFSSDVFRRIVGVVADERHERIGEAPRGGTYTPVRQFWWSRFAVVVRTAGDLEGVVSGVREAVRAVDPRLPIYDIRPLAEVVRASYGTSRFATDLTTSLAGLALLLAIAGVFGVASHGVAARTVEIGVRVALGASPRDVRRAVVRPTMLVVALGVGIGLALAAAGASLVAHLLHETSPHDPLAYAVAAVVVIAAGLVATWWPARRAGRIDPLAALRQQ
ncbi:MAG TPA: ABC transporter permease [Vicinamibacterales bacterium]|nr:ABC transporter permease [Vicinamibacterales bacterium]